MRAGDIVACEFEHRKNQYNQMNVTFTAEFSRYETILKTKNWGIRLQTETQDLGFVYYDAIERPYGKFEVKLMSGAYLIQTDFLDNKDRFYQGSLATFLSSLTSYATFTPITGDYTIELVTGSLDNLALMNEAIKYPDFTEWVDAGLINTGGTTKVDIVYGDFRSIEAYYESTDDGRFAPVYINNYSNTDNEDDPNTLYVEEYKISRQYERPTLLYPYVDNGTGASENTRTELTQTNPKWLNPQFPIVERVSPITGRTVRYIRNPFTDNYRERVQVYVLDNTSNSEDQTGTAQVTKEISEQLLYRRAIWYISMMGNQPTPSINPVIKRITLAGTLAKMDFVEKTYNQDGSPQTSVVIDGDRIMDNLTYNLETIYD